MIFHRRKTNAANLAGATDTTSAASALKFWRLPQEKVTTFHLIFSCLLALLPFIQMSPWWISVMAGLLLSWRGIITITGHQLPAKWLLAAITMLLLAIVYWQLNWLNRDTGVSILVVLACLKLLEMHARRDAMAVVFVSYFLLAGQLFYSQSLLTALYLGLCLIFLFSVQQTYHYHHMAPPFSHRLRHGARVLGLAIPLALLLFLLFPRIQGPLWGKPEAHPYGVTGLSDFMQPGNIAELLGSDQIAFRVKFSGNGGIPAPQNSYWRTIVLDRYDGQRWISSPAANTLPQKALDRLPSHPGNVIAQHIIMEPSNQHWLFALDLPTSLPNPGEFSLQLTQRWEVHSNRLVQERLQYDVLSQPGNSLQQILTPAELRNSLQLPKSTNPLTINWARQLQQQTPNPALLVQQVLSHFRNQPFHYTLSPPVLGEQQIDDFMFSTRSGFCEHYSSAFVFIMRAMGIPARVVTGYQGGEMNPIDGLMTIRQSDAHAWAEVWLDQQGWVRIDPTAAIAPGRVQHELAQHYSDGHFSGLINLNEHAWLRNMALHLRANWDALNSAWNLWGLNYNWDKQKSLLYRLGFENPQLSQLPLIMAISASLMSALLAIFLLWKQSNHEPLDKLYQQFCSIMEKHGHPRLPHEGPTHYSQRLQPIFSDNSQIINFLHLFSRCKYGKEYNSSNYTALKLHLKKCRQLTPPP